MKTLAVAATLAALPAGSWGTSANAAGMWPPSTMKPSRTFTVHAGGRTLTCYRWFFNRGAGWADWCAAPPTVKGNVA